VRSRRVRRSLALQGVNRQTAGSTLPATQPLRAARVIHPLSPRQRHGCSPTGRAIEERIRDSTVTAAIMFRSRSRLAADAISRPERNPVPTDSCSRFRSAIRMRPLAPARICGPSRNSREGVLASVASVHRGTPRVCASILGSYACATALASFYSHRRGRPERSSRANIGHAQSLQPFFRSSNSPE
jgi:hypothetical protein